MNIAFYAFRPRLVPTLATAALVALTTWLGLWQVDRAQQKRERQALLEARMAEAPVRLTGPGPGAQELLYRHVVATGHWNAAGQVFVDNQVHEGRAGFHVVTPLAIDGSAAAVLVNRGWVARDASYPNAPPVAVPGGEVRVAGLATLPPARFIELSAEGVTGNVWQNLSIDRYRSVMHAQVLPVVVLADAPGPGLAAVHEVPDAGVAKHQEYALTWFSLAATALVLWIVLNVERRR